MVLSMKIDKQDNSGAVPSTAAKGAADVNSGGRSDAARGIDGSGSDHAELSGLAGKISRAVSQEAKARAAKVERLRVEVAEGSYRADAAATSRAIVDESLSGGATDGRTPKK